jgi:hypothetical protein
MQDPHSIIRTKLAQGCTEDEFLRMRCPKCNSKLELRVHPKLNGLHVYCPVSKVHLGMHVEADVGPAWWERYVQPLGWY